MSDTRRGAAARVASFDDAYQALIDAWPCPVIAETVPTDYGATHVLMCGDESGPVLLFLPGGGATAAVWSAVAAPLASHYRVLAVDPIGQPGRSIRGQWPVDDLASLNDWLDRLVDALAIDRLTLVGHSYGAWMALRYGMHAPRRVDGLVLVDPTDCFIPMRTLYRLRAVPLFARPSASRLRRFLAWETRGKPLSPSWLSVAALGADLGRPAIVAPRCPSPNDLAHLNVPTLVIAAGRSQAHHPAKMLRRVGERLPGASQAVVPGATHHTLPTEDADQVVAAIQTFLGSS
jgi:pimeloyl-ACP methyl ester carboxylesterase